MKILADWSKERNFFFGAYWTIRRLINGGDWIKKIIKLSYDEKELYCCVASSVSPSNPIMQKYYKELIENKTTEFRSFNDLMDYCQIFRVVEFNHQNWKHSKCNCVGWKKFYICNHVISVAFELICFEWPT